MCSKPGLLSDTPKVCNKSSTLSVMASTQEEEARIKSNLFQTFILSEVLSGEGKGVWIILKPRNEVVNKC